MKYNKHLVEALAELEHDQWVTWSKELAQTEKLSEDRLKRWKTLWVPCEKLPDDIKEFDKAYAKLVLAVIQSKVIDNTLKKIRYHRDRLDHRGYGFTTEWGRLLKEVRQVFGG